MTNPQSLLHGLEAYVQDEIGARQRMLDIVTRQEEAVLHGRANDLEVATRELEQELAAQVDRSNRRQRHSEDHFSPQGARHWHSNHGSQRP